MKTTKKREKYKPEELAESLVFPVEATPAQEKEDALAIKKLRDEALKIMSPSRLLAFKILQLKYQIEDYLKTSGYDANLTFGHFLRVYIEAINKKNKEFAHDVSIKPTELSQIINDHRKPKEEIIIRLGIHSNKVIPAITWYRLLEKEKEYELLHNKQLWEGERKHVRNKLEVQL